MRGPRAFKGPRNVRGMTRGFLGIYQDFWGPLSLISVRVRAGLRLHPGSAHPRIDTAQKLSRNVFDSGRDSHCSGCYQTPAKG